MSSSRFVKSVLFLEKLYPDKRLLAAQMQAVVTRSVLGMAGVVSADFSPASKLTKLVMSRAIAGKSRAQDKVLISIRFITSLQK